MSYFSTQIHSNKQTHSAYVTRTCVSWTCYLTVWSVLENAYNFKHHFRVREQLVDGDFRTISNLLKVRIYQMRIKY